MPNPSASPTARVCSERAVPALFLLLVVLAFAWRMPYAATAPIVQVDEVKYSLPTVKRLLAGDPVLYISGTNYGAPLEQAIAAGLFAGFGESAGAFRFPTALLGSLAVGVFFLALRRSVGIGAALGITLPLALANSSIARYTTFSHGCYSTLLLTVGLIQIATMRVDEKRTVARWLVLGVLMGTGIYVLKLAIFQAFASLVWLWLRSDHFERLRYQLGEARLRRRFLAGIFTAGLGMLAIAPVLYRFLTRRATYAISPLEKWLVIAAAFFCAAGAALVLSALPIPRFREFTPVAGALALLVLIPMPAALWFQKIELPRLAAQGIEPYAEASYSFKHLHEWPNQARIMIEGVFPAVIVGRWNEVRGFEESERETLGWRAAVTAVLLAVLALGDFFQRRAGKQRPDLRSADFIFIVPFILTLAVLFPSWSLHSESSFRYLLPFLPGMFLIAYRCLEAPITAHPRVAAAFLALYAAYCAFDCFHHIA
ncbi:MAG: hypothetical protein ABIP20_01095 [Chthoniobacteraceae bacterium]